MHKVIGTIIFGVLLSIAQVASAGPLDESNAAFKRGDYATALKLSRPLAENGDAQAQYRVGYLYYEGKGVARDYSEAVKWYRLAADQGYSAAQFNLGFMYYEGRGVAQDHKEAVKWYRKVADQGHARAQINLAVMFAEGKGVSQNYVEAYMWLTLAAASSSGEIGKDVATNRDIVAKKMTQQQIAEAQAMARKCQQSNFKNCGEP